MVDVSQYTGLITSEHADKPKFTAMVSAVAQCFVDQQNALGNFIPSFDLDEAVGDQLDTLGAWVGIGRRVRTPLTGVYFSFDIAGVGFDQGVWQGPFDPSTGITVLDDDTYRLLIRAKIGANHWDGTLASSAAILNLIFQGGTAPRHLTATNELFATADGVKGAFQLSVGGIPVYSNINVASIYRNDWQGNQLLYATARTNSIFPSTPSSAWSKIQAGDTLQINGLLAPDGSTTMTGIIESVTSATHGVNRSAANNPSVDGNIHTVTGSLKAGSRGFARIEFVGNANSSGSRYVFDLTNGLLVSATPTGANGTIGTASIVAGANGTWYVVCKNPPGTSTGNAAMAVYIEPFIASNNGVFAGDGTVGIWTWGFDVFYNQSFAGSHIPTSTAAVTVTDYTIGPTGLVAMGQKPVSGAQLTWNGTGDAYPGGTQVFIEDHQDMSISFGVAGKLPSALFLALLSGGYVPIKPEGVHVRDYVTTSVDGSPIFGFDMMGPYVAGFDVGTWGTPLH